MPDTTVRRMDICKKWPAGLGCRIVLLLGLMFSTGCGANGLLPSLVTDSSGADRVAEKAETAPINGTGLLWRIDHLESAPSYVFGTMHVSDPRIVVLPPAVEDAFNLAHVVVLESIKDEEKDKDIDAMLRLPEGGDLEQIIGPDLFEAIYRLGEPEEDFKEKVRRMQPWAAAMMVEQLNRSPSGAAVLDDRLQDAAQAGGKQVFGLETAEENLAVYKDLPDMHQIDLLRATLESVYAPPQIRLAAREADIRAYMAREPGVLLQRWNTAYGGGDQSLQQFGDRLMDQRSVRFVERMVPWIEKGNTFIAFGAAHLPGENGVIAMLHNLGFNVVAVY